MIPCVSCGKPMIYPQKILYWAECGEYLEFLHLHCEPTWAQFCALRGTFTTIHLQEYEYERVRRREANQESYWHALHKYETELKAKGLLPYDEDETQTIETEEARCARQVQ